VRPSLRVFPDSRSFVDGAAGFIAEVADEAIAERGRFTAALSGGRTPKAIYARLAAADYRDRLEGKKCHLFFGDERCVAPEDSRSNFRMARETWFDPASLPAENIHRIHGEDDPAREALRYEKEIAQFHQTNAFPAFDLILLGLGDDGHTASLFPETAALRETSRAVVAQYVEKLTEWRVTFTAPLINAARHVAFLVEGAGKAQILRSVLEGPYQPDVWPAQLIQPGTGKLHWLADAAAAEKLETSSASA
jgi:6-phosphogluconolactonase